MNEHIPTPPGVEPAIAPDHAAGAWTNCECSLCTERRLADDRHVLYTPHDLADAWRHGWHTGFTKGLAAPPGAPHPETP